VFQDACHNLVGERQGAPPGSSVHNGAATRPHAFEERPQFGPQRFFPLRRERREIKFGLRTGFGNPDS